MQRFICFPPFFLKVKVCLQYCKHGVGLAESRREESEPFPPFFPFAVGRAVIELWDSQTLVRILRGFERDIDCVPANMCAARKRLVTAHSTIRQRSVFPCRLYFPPSRETRSTLEQCNIRLRGNRNQKIAKYCTQGTQRNCTQGTVEKEARHARGRRTCLFPTQCIARYTEG